MPGRRDLKLLLIPALLLLASVSPGLAEGKPPKGKIVAESGRASRGEATRIARTLGSRNIVRSAAFAARPPYGRPAAISTKRLGGFPLSGRKFMILSSGNALFADNKNSEPDTSQNAGGPTIRGARDVTIFRVNVRVPKKDNCLSVRFRFLTEEFPEFVKSEFNDAFIAELDDTTWTTNTIGSPRISAPNNFAFGPAGRLISVNGIGSAGVSAGAAKGTTYDGATRKLRASTRTTSGTHRLYLSIFDQGDRQYDSAVFLDRLTTSRRATCKSGVVGQK